MESAGGLLADAAAPLIGAFVAGKAVADCFEDDTDKVGYGVLAAGGAALVCATPPGAAVLGVVCTARLLWTAGKIVYNRLA